MLFGKMKQNLTARILSRIWRNNKNDVILFIMHQITDPDIFGEKLIIKI